MKGNHILIPRMCYAKRQGQCSCATSAMHAPTCSFRFASAWSLLCEFALSVLNVAQQNAGADHLRLARSRIFANIRNFSVSKSCLCRPSAMLQLNESPPCETRRSHTRRASATDGIPLLKQIKHGRLEGLGLRNEGFREGCFISDACFTVQTQVYVYMSV